MIIIIFIYMGYQMIVEKFMFYKDKLPILDLVEFKKLS